MWRRIALTVVLATIAFLVWRAELFTVARPGDRARPLEPLPTARAVHVDVRLPQVPAGVRHIATGRDRPLLVHYWAPWERHGGPQVQALDSLARLAPWSEIDVTVVCFDPFPSLARYVARRRLTVAVVLDHRRELAQRLPCPSVPYTYVVDDRGNVVVAQAGEVDWTSTRTRETLDQVLQAGKRATGHSVAARSSPVVRSGDSTMALTIR